MYESIAVEIWSNWFSLLLFVYHNSLVIQWLIEEHSSPVIGTIIGLYVRL